MFQFNPQVDDVYCVSSFLKVCVVIESWAKCSSVSSPSCTFGSCPNLYSSSRCKNACNTRKLSVCLKIVISKLSQNLMNECQDEHLANNFTLLRSKIRRLPQIHQATLKAIVEHLARIASHSDKNKMDPKNLAIVFGSVIFGEDEIPKGGDLLGMQAWKVLSYPSLL